MLFGLPQASQPVRTASQPSMREGGGWHGARRVDSYRPTTTSITTSVPRSAAEVFMQSSQPVVQKGDRILAAVESE